MIIEKIAQNPVITVSKNAGVDEAAKLMRDAHVGDLVVVELDERGEIPVSILTDRDIVVSTIALGIDPRTLRVEDIMSIGLVTAKAGDVVAVLAAELTSVATLPRKQKRDETQKRRKLA